MSTGELQRPLPVIESPAPPTAAGPVLFHLSLNVSDLSRSVEFYRVLFGREPAKLRHDYAKFELADPPLVLALEPFSVRPGGSLNHLGFRLPDAVTLVEFQRRLEMSGISTCREEGVECCYARQTKFWVPDPDGNQWEIYTFEGEIEDCGGGSVPNQIVATPAQSLPSGPPPAKWVHRLGDRFPPRLPIDDATVDEVLLEGTFNSDLSLDDASRILAEVLRILKPGGQLQVHLLTSNRPLGETALILPGPAAVVKRVPVDADVTAALQAAGFSEIRFVQLSKAPVFVVSGCELREARIKAMKLGFALPALHQMSLR